jgi:hypothetical protein
VHCFWICIRLDTEGAFQQIAVCDSNDLHAFDHQHAVWVVSNAAWTSNYLPEFTGNSLDSIK